MRRGNPLRKFRGATGRIAAHGGSNEGTAWCPCCALDAATHFATFALAVPEALRALRGSIWVATPSTHESCVRYPDAGLTGATEK